MKYVRDFFYKLIMVSKGTQHLGSYNYNKEKINREPLSDEVRSLLDLLQENKKNTIELNKKFFELINKNNDVVKYNDGYFLYRAVRDNNVFLAEFLLNAGADPYSKNGVIFARVLKDAFIQNKETGLLNVFLNKVHNLDDFEKTDGYKKLIETDLTAKKVIKFTEKIILKNKINKIDDENVKKPNKI